MQVVLKPDVELKTQMLQLLLTREDGIFLESNIK